MARALWLIRYALDGQNESAYLDWFHGEHIPEKRSRPGYAWAAHYADGAGRYLAVFAADDARTFLEATPGQWKLRQDPVTRQMSAHRRDVAAWIVVEVLRAGMGDATPPAVRLALPQALNQAEEDASAASLAQERLPALAQSPGCIWASFMVPVIGAGRHVLFEAHRQLPAGPADFAGRRIDGGR